MVDKNTVSKELLRISEELDCIDFATRESGPDCCIFCGEPDERK